MSVLPYRLQLGLSIPCRNGQKTAERVALAKKFAELYLHQLAVESNLSLVVSTWISPGTSEYISFSTSQYGTVTRQGGMGKGGGTTCD